MRAARTIAGIAAACTATWCCAEERTVERFTISAAVDFERVEAALARSTADEIVITIAEGRYVLDGSFAINRSDVSLVGEGEVMLVLADEANCPVLAVGSQVEQPSKSEAIENVYLAGFSIDGNRSAQSSQFDRERPWIRNNGIDARCVHGLVVERIDSSNNRSGGFVVSWGSSDVLVLDSQFERNEFDGIAYYDSQRVHTINCRARANRSAGISIDNKMVNTVFARCLLESNGDVGVFVRNSTRVFFQDCEIRDSGDWAFFLAHDDNGLGVQEAVVVGCRLVSNNGGIHWASIEDRRASDFIVSGNRFHDNDRHEGRQDFESCGDCDRQSSREVDVEPEVEMGDGRDVATTPSLPEDSH